MTSDLPGGTVTFLFTDIEGSTPLWEREPGPMRAALAQHDAILQQVVAAHQGVHHKAIGDAIQAAFALPADAVAAALACAGYVDHPPVSELSRPGVAVVETVQDRHGLSIV